MASGKSFGALVVVRAGLPDRRVVIFFLGAGPRGIFLVEFQKTITQAGIGGIAGKAAATLGLFEKVERLIHRFLAR
jgi:hypothetical protein